MIPVATELQARGNNIFIGSGKEIANLFRNEIAGLKYIHFPGFRIKYSVWLPQYLKIALMAPSFIYHIKREHRLLKRIIKEHSIDILISDSRPGLWNKEVVTVFVTHMMRVPWPKWLRFNENAGTSLIRKIFARFDYCYIPDLPGEINLSGKLSHVIDIPENVRYIGILSRFSKEIPEPVSLGPEYYFAVILSGPEPQRSMLKNRIENILEKSGKPSVILEGKPGEEVQRETRGNLVFINHLPAGEMKNIILRSRYIITRSGYTTIMELVSIGKTALIIPTPGQIEQEYLAGFMAEKGWFVTASQQSLKELPALPVNDSKWPLSITSESSELLNNALNELLE
jgi:hypothetical protein